MSSKIQLIAQSKSKGDGAKNYELTAGMGDGGQAIRVKAESGVRYELLDLATRQGPRSVRAKRAGRDLEIFLEGSVKADAVIEGYYDEALVASPADSLTGLNPTGDLGVYVIDAGLRPALSTLASDIAPIVLSNAPLAWLPFWGVAAGAFGASILLSSGNSAPAVGDLVIKGSVTAGPVSTGVKLYAYDSQGKLLGTADIQSDGTFSITVQGRGDYRGAVLLKAVDSNNNAANYLDEVTASQKSIDTELRAMGVANEAQGAKQFSVNGLDATLVIHITPVTELAVIKAGITTDAAPASPATVLQANQAVAKVLGLTGVDITIRPVPTNSPEFDASKDGLSDSEKYGLLLTKLSGLDSLNGGSLTVSLTQLSQNIDISGNATITAQGAALVDQGRQQALAALKTAPSASEKTFLTDSTLNRQLLGDVIVTEQTLDAQGKLLVSGSALPGSTVNVTLPSGEVQAVVANSAGVFTLTSATAQPKLEVPLQLTGADGLSQPAYHVTPAAPQIETGNGKVVSGSGTPGSTVTLTGVDGRAIGTALVDALGQWSLVPPTPLADDAVLKASAKDPSGNVSGPGAGTVDVEQVSVSLAEAADGYINAAEKAGDGISFAIWLPASARAGDKVSTVVSLPNGSTLTLDDVLTAAQITSGAITRTLSPAQLANDGLYNSAISLVTLVGQSVPVRTSFVVDATAPLAPQVSPSNGQIINGTAEPGTTVTVRDALGSVIGTTGPVGNDGNWTVLPAQPLPDAAVLSATATDPAGNTSGPGTNRVFAAALLITGAIDSVGPQLGLLADGSTTNDNSPQLAGTLGTVLMPGQRLVVYRQLGNGTPVKVGEADINGTAWTFQDGEGTQLNAPLADGNYTWQVVVETASGPVSGLAPSGFFDLVIDTARPAAPATTVPEATGADRFINAAEKASDLGVPIVTQLAASARAGDVVTTTVTLPDGSTRVLSTTLKPAEIQAGRISQLLAQSALAADGAYSASTTLTSAVNGLTSAATVNSFTLDTTAPAAGTGALAAVSDTGTLGDNKTNDNTPALSGTAEANATVQVAVNGQTYTVTANAQGAWSLPATATLPDGTHTPVITVTDAAGNSSTAICTPFTVDASAPSAPAVALTEAANGVSAAEAASLGGTPIVTTLPADAKVGDTVTTVVTKPNGTTSTLSTVLTAADLPPAQGGTATGAGPFTISQLIPSSALTVDGAWTTSTTLTDVVGNTSGATAGSFTLDTTAPTAPGVSLPESPNGVSAAEAASAGGTPIVTTLPADAKVGDTVTTVVTKPNGTTSTLSTVLTAADLPPAQGGTVTGAGPFTISQLIPSSALTVDGAWTTSTTLTDVVGNTSGATAGSFTLDTTAPTAPGVSLPESPNGISAAEAASAGGTPIVTTLPADAKVGDTVTTVVTNPNGTTSTLSTVLTAADLPPAQGGTATGAGPFTISQLIPSSALTVDGAWTTSTTLIDASGNTGPASSGGFVLETVLPPAPSALLAASSDTGFDNTDNLTNDTTPTISGGAATPGDTITLYKPDGVTVLGTAVVGFNGTWQITLAPADALADGVHNLKVTATDPAGNESPPTTVAITLDTQAPSVASGGLKSDATNDTGPSANDDVTSNRSPVLEGVAEQGSTVRLEIGGRTYETTAGAGGRWSVNLAQDVPVGGLAPMPGLPDGIYTPQITVLDPAGNSASGPGRPFTVDAGAPGSAGVAIPEAAGGVSAAEAANGVQITVQLPADAAVGDIVRTTITPPGGGAPIELVTGPLTSADLQQRSITQTVLPTDLSDGQGGYRDGVWQTSTTLTDVAGNQSQPQTDSFRLSANAPSLVVPAITGDDTLNATEKSGSVPVTGTTSAEPGQTVTVTFNGQSYTAQVQAGAQGQPNTFSVPIPANALANVADGNYPVVVSVSNSAGTPAQAITRTLRVDATAPTLAISTISGDDVSAANSGGTFSAVERGDLASTTVTTPPVIAGTTSAEVGQTVTIVLAGGAQVFTTTVGQGGAWSYALTNAEALALNHGTTYTVRVTVSDLAGNQALPDSDNRLVVDIAPPDVPTINQTFSGTTTPTLTGRAMKVNPGNSGNFIALANVDTVSITLNGVTVTGTIGSLPVGLTYNTVNGTWALDTATAGSFGLVDGTAYDVVVSVTAGGTSKADISSGELLIDTTPPTITLDPISQDTSGNNVINAAEQAQALAITGTTTAQPGSTVTLTGLDGQTYTAVVQAGANNLNTFSIPLSGAQVDALLDGTKNLNASVTNLYGLVNSAAATLRVDTVAPSQPSLTLLEASGGVNQAEAASGGGTPIVVTIPGNAVAGDTVTTVITKPDGSRLVLTRVLDSTDIQNGTITQLIASAELAPDGQYAVSTNVTDTAGNTSQAATANFTLDTTAPSQPTVTLPEAPFGVNDAEALSAGGTPLVVNIPANAQAGDTVTTIVTKPDSTTVSLSVVLQPSDITSGHVTLTILTAELALNGQYDTSTTVTDAAGNPSTARVVPFTVDRSAPTAPAAAPDMAAATDTGSSNSDDLTADTTPSFKIDALPSDATGAVLLVNGQAVPAALSTDGSGNTLLTPIGPLPDGTHAISYALVDAAGNQSAPSPALSVAIDTTAPSQPAAPDLLATSDTGSSNTDNLTSDTTPTFTVPTGQGNAILLVNGTPVAATYDPATGSLTPDTPLPDGNYTIAIQVVDAAGNASAPSPALSVTIDTTPPATPSTAPDMTTASDSGSSNTDNITNNPTPGFNIGVIPAGTTPVLVINGQVVAATVTTDGNNTILTPSTPLTDGNYNISHALTDASGNQSAAGPALPVTIDTTLPAATGGSPPAATPAPAIRMA